jgi:hypothetical protein
MYSEHGKSQTVDDGHNVGRNKSIMAQKNSLVIGW